MKNDYQNIAMTHGIGVLDTLSFDTIAGWAWDPDRPDEPIHVEILDGSEQIAIVKADLARPDLAELGIGNGRHGFHFNFGGTILPYGRHLLRVRRLNDGADLATSPRVLERERTGLDRATIRYIDGIFSSEADVAKSPADLNFSLSLLAAQLNRLLERQLQLTDSPASADLGELGALIDTATPSQWIAAATRSLSAKYPPISLPTSAEPLVSVIIPVYGKFHLTYDCIVSISQNLPKCAIEIIIVDDCSKDETILAPLVFSGTVRVLRNDTNVGFVKGCNRGADAARGQYLFFLNNDTLVRPGWLDTLVQTFEDVPNVGIAGSKLLFGDGSLQEVGGIIWRMGDGWNWGRNADPEDPRFSYLRDADYVSGAALLIRTELFRDLGGFDLHFAPAYYEDTDLCFRVRQAGRRVVVQPQSIVVHLEGQTSGTSVTGSGMKRFQAINHRKFYDRWKPVLAGHRFNAQHPELECERSVTRRAVFIDETVPTPDQDAGSNAALQHMRSLMRLGYKVTFIPADNMARISPYTEALQAIGIECVYHPFYWSVEEYFRKCQVPVDVVYLHRFANGTKYAGLIRRNQPKARIIYNVADLHYLRMEREASVTGDKAAAKRAAAVKIEELAAIQSVDVTIVHSSIEKDELSTAVPDANVHVVPWAYQLRPVKTPISSRRGVVFVGGYRHTPNVDAAKWLVEQIMPIVWQAIPDVPVTLVGSNMPDELKSLSSDKVHAVGYVPDVNEVYEHCLLSIAPLRYGAGVKGKVLEASAAGLPCVMTSCAAEGVALRGDMKRVVADDAAGLARQIIDLHRDRSSTEKLSELALQMMADCYSERTVDQAISKTLR